MITHLRGVLGDQTYESFAQMGRAMTIAEMVAYAYGQIDPGLSRTQRRLVIDDLREPRKSVAVPRHAQTGEIKMTLTEQLGGSL